MPSCFVAGCSSKSSSKKQSETVSLHVFPKHADSIVAWLRCCGVPDNDLHFRTSQVIADARGFHFRVCSLHFSPDQYQSTSKDSASGKRGRLILGAIPNQKLAPQSAYAPVPIVPEQMSVDSVALQTVVSELDEDMFTDSYCCSTESQTMCSFTSMVSIACQTNFDEQQGTEVQMRHNAQIGEKNIAGLQWPEYEYNFEGDFEKVKKDHGYYCRTAHQSPPVTSAPLHESTPVKGPLQQLMTAMEMEDISIDVSESSFEHCVVGESTDSSSGEKDPDFTETSLPMDDSFCEHKYNEMDEVVCEKKYLVFRTCLLALFRMVCCNFKSGGKKCRRTLVNFETKEMGSCLIVEGCCFDNHPPLKWRSQPMLGRVSAGNLLIGSSIFFSGLNFEKAASFAAFIGMEFISRTTYYNYQKSFIFPTVHEAWDHEQMDMDIKFSGQKIRVAGDGQCDSPGFSAKYLVYTVMEQSTSKILCVIVVQVTECTSSVAMEKRGLVIALDSLLKRGLDIEVLTTDRHVSVSKVMREQYKNINHQYDVWHMAKSLKKKLMEASKQKGCGLLGAWSQSITNHLWWCSRTCQKSLELLNEKWMSVMLHTTNRHRWHSYHLFHACEHEPLAAEEQRKKQWLKPETPAHDALVKIVCNKVFRKDLRGLTEFTHTGALESFHSMVLKYRSKNYHYTYDGMEARTKLAALTHNYNTGRQQARKKVDSSDEENEGELRHKLVFTKSRKEWIAKKIFEGMDFGHVYEMLVHVLEIQQLNLCTYWQPHDDIPKNIALVEAPPKAEVVAKMFSRF